MELRAGEPLDEHLICQAGGEGAFQAFPTHCSEHLVYKWRGLLWWGVGDFACHGLTCTGPHRCVVRAVTRLLVKPCVPLDPQEE